MEIITITDSETFRAVKERMSGSVVDAKAEAAVEKKTAATQAIIEAVRTQGDAAVAEYTARFDGVTLEPEAFEVEPEAIERAAGSVDAKLLGALERAAANIRRFHSKHLRESWEETLEDGTVLGQRIAPLERVGVYVPGGCDG